MKKSIRKGRVLPKRVFPHHLGVETPEEWRGLKRMQWLDVMHAIQRFDYGSAYAPGGHALYQLQRLARQIEEAVKAEDWIAW